MLKTLWVCVQHYLETVTKGDLRNKRLKNTRNFLLRKSRKTSLVSLTVGCACTSSVWRHSTLLNLQRNAAHVLYLRNNGRHSHGGSCLVVGRYSADNRIAILPDRGWTTCRLVKHPFSYLVLDVSDTLVEFSLWNWAADWRGPRFHDVRMDRSCWGLNLSAVWFVSFTLPWWQIRQFFFCFDSPICWPIDFPSCLVLLMVLGKWTSGVAIFWY